MKTSIKIFALGLVLAGFGVNANAQTSANSSATIIAPISLANTDAQPLAFGNIISDATGGSVTVSTAGVSTPSGVKVPSVTGAISAAKFTVTGLAGSTYSITLPASAEIKLNGTGTIATEVMALGTFRAKTTTGSDGATSGTIEVGGSEVFTVGATLAVKANQVAGPYTGTFSVTVAYN